MKTDKLLIFGIILGIIGLLIMALGIFGPMLPMADKNTSLADPSEINDMYGMQENVINETPIDIEVYNPEMIPEFTDSATETENNETELPDDTSEETIIESPAITPAPPVVTEPPVPETMPEPPIIAKPPAPETSPPEPVLKLVSVTSPIFNGESATLVIIGKPNTEYTISVYYPSGLSESKDLEAKISDNDGNVSWTWKVGTTTSEGEHKITISGGGETINTSFTTSKST